MTGTGTREDPYIIMTVDDLQDMQDDLDAYYELGGDIDASATIGWNGGLGFAPVTTFTGHFDGKSYTISALFINRPATNRIGLFAIAEVATILNVKLTNANITGNGSVGSLIGASYASTVIDCSSENVTIAGNGGGVGGLIGIEYGYGSDVSVQILRCHTTGSVTVADGSSVGGLMGSLLSNGPTTLSDCYSTATVTSSEDFACYAGGLIGGVAVSAPLTISGCYATGDVSGDGGSDVGGLFGALNTTGSGSIDVDDCYATGDVTSVGTFGQYVGGFVGDVVGTGITLDNCYATGDVSASGYVGGFVGINGYGGVTGATIQDCHAAGAVNCNDYDNAGGFIGDNHFGAISRCYSTGDIAGTGAIECGGFAGGNEDTDSEMSECYSTGDVSCDDYAGGFTGYNGGPINDCYSRGSVTVSETVEPVVGGFIGINNPGGTIENCYSTGLVTSAVSPDKGGFFGWSRGTITNCFWDKETSALTIDGTLGTGGIGIATGKTTKEMKTKKTFLDANWDFSTIWGRFQYCNDSYPCLREVTAGCSVKYFGNINVDQLIYQHAERMERFR